MVKFLEPAFPANQLLPWTKLILGSLGAWLLTTVSPAPARGAEQISLVYGPLQFSLPVDALESYARTGEVTNEFAFYARRASPQQLAALRALLQTCLQVNSTTAAQFTYSQVGEAVLQRLGQVVRTESGQDGFFALRSALILAAADSNGLTVINVLRRFPTRSIRFDLKWGLQAARTLTRSAQAREAVFASIQRLAAAETASTAPFNFLQQPDLQQPGPFPWQRQTFQFRNSTSVSKLDGQRRFPADVYLPQPRPAEPQRPAPLIVISHGAASDRSTFAYLAQHLASHGFAVAVLEHGDNAQRFRQFYAGFARPLEPTELLQRPLDVKYLLDELQRWSETDSAWRNRLNLQQVGVIGHSLGGYTALVLAGAKLNAAQLRQNCRGSKPQNTTVNLSMLVQCEANTLAPTMAGLQDKRVKAVIAINPLASSILGQRGVSQIKVPVMLVGSGADIFTPAIPEQIIPFTWLTTPNKYLVLVKRGTHFSMLNLSPIGGGGLPPLPTALIGPNPDLTRRYLQGLSVAFAQTHLANQPQYQPYLGSAYANVISQAPLDLSLVQSLTTKQLDQARNDLSTTASNTGKE